MWSVQGLGPEGGTYTRPWSSGNDTLSAWSPGVDFISSKGGLAAAASRESVVKINNTRIKTFAALETVSLQKNMF
jgi:hypothetical protein